MTRTLVASLGGALLVASGLGLWLDRGRRGGLIEMAALATIVPLAAIAVTPAPVGPAWAALVPALVIAVLLRARDDLLHSECALKLLWVMAPALALSGAGLVLLTAETGTSFPAEQWGVLAYQLEPRMLWTTALALSLLCGIVLLGGAPFHFWPADLVQGARPWIAAPSLAALEIAGAAWLASRLHGIEALPDAARIADTLVGTAAGVALFVGAITIQFQRRPERRVGTLASLNGALALATLSIGHTAVGRAAMAIVPGPVWAAHLALALMGASTLAPFLTVSQRQPDAGPVLFRRHPVWGGIGFYALASLAGVPGTPGALLWLAVGRSLVLSSRPVLVVMLAAAWASAFTAVVTLAREALGIATTTPLPPAPVPRAARWAMLVATAGLVALWTRGMR